MPVVISLNDIGDTIASKKSNLVHIVKIRRTQTQTFFVSDAMTCVANLLKNMAHRQI